MKIFPSLSVFALAAILAPAATAAPVPAGLVTGPIAAGALPGNPSHDYPFFASNHDLAAHGYVEEEYFIKGSANTYDTPDMATGTVKDGDHPYLTRIVVRRPDPAHFNGIVLVEDRKSVV